METEQDRFMRLAYARTVAAARKVFRSWHICKREDAVQEAVVKMLDQWLRLVQRGGDPEPIIGGMIYHALMFVRYDRKVAGRARRPDVFGSGKRDRSDIVKLGGPADVRAIFTRARHFDFGPPFAGRILGRD